MSYFKRILFLSALLLLAGAGLKAQTLPDLGRDPAIKTGSLPNGLRYYLVTSGASKGRADYAIVREDGSAPAPDMDFCRFLSSKGVGYSAEGFVTRKEEGSVVHFRNIPVFDAAAADSTLLMMFDLIRSSACPQTIIISGDIDSDQLADRMYVLSMTVPMLPGACHKDKEPWKADSDLHFITTSLGGGLSRTSLSFTSPRTPEEQMNTAIPFISGRFSSLLEIILRQRIARAFKDRDIPVADIDLRHEDSSVRPGDELYSISVVTEESASALSESIISGIIEDLLLHGALESELSGASTRLASRAVERSAIISNDEYVQRCVRAELYGASLAPYSATDKYTSFSKLSASKELPLLNDFLYAIFDPENTRQRDIDSTAVPAAAPASLPGKPAKGKLKLKSSAAEPLTGGELWTFSNGMKVVFKSEKTPGRFVYSLMIKGGAPVSADILTFFDVAGASGAAFRDLLLDGGITMRCRISEADLRLSGEAPTDKLPLLLSALSSLSTGREFNPSDYDYSLRCNVLRRRSEGFDAAAALEQMSSPGYAYNACQLEEKAGPEMMAGAGKYFDSQFSRMNDGVMVIIGDFSSDALQKALLGGLSSFQCGKATTVRQRIRHDRRKGWYTRMRSPEDFAAMSVSFSNPFSLENHMAFRIASAILRQEVTKELSGLGMYAEFSEDVEYFPSESFTVSIICRPCDRAGLPEGIRKQSTVDALNAMRRAVNSLSRADFKEAFLKACKDELSCEMATLHSTPSFVADAVATRYSVGRDNLSSYQSAIDGVSASLVSEMLRHLQEGAIMEIVSK